MKGRSFYLRTVKYQIAFEKKKNRLKKMFLITKYEKYLLCLYVDSNCYVNCIKRGYFFDEIESSDT